VKAQLFIGRECVAEIDAPDPPPPKVWAEKQAEIVGMELDQDTGTLLIERKAPKPTHDVFGLTAVVNGIAHYELLP
jgi:hypothetical protein